MKIVSILITAYKAERWLEDCLQSVRAQSLPAGVKAEILLGIDGCEASFSAARRLMAADMKIVYFAANSGPYVSFNRLLHFASGDWICRFDADDVMGQGFLWEQLERLGRGANMTATWSVFADEHLRPTSIVLAHDHYRPANGEHRYGAEGCFVAERSVWDRVGGFRPWRCGADTDFRDRVVASGLNICVVEKFLYHRRVHRNSLTAHPSTNFKSQIRQRYIELLDQYRLTYRQADADCRIRPVCADVSQIYG